MKLLICVPFTKLRFGQVRVSFKIGAYTKWYYTQYVYNPTPKSAASLPLFSCSIYSLLSNRSHLFSLFSLQDDAVRPRAREISRARHNVWNIVASVGAANVVMDRRQNSDIILIVDSELVTVPPSAL